MAATTDTTLHQVIDIARRLSPRDRAQLIAVLAQELAEPQAAPVSNAWARWAALRADITQHYPDARLGDRLEADRRERDESVRGVVEATDVHP